MASLLYILVASPLYILEALVFQNVPKWMLSSLNSQAIFFWEYFYLKNYRKNHVPSSLISWWEGIPLLLSIVFPQLRLRRHSQKILFTDET